jgi:ABC-2 type transport system permease protein
MWPQIIAIAWAQLRIARNHLPRTSAGSVLMWLISLVWYGIYTALAVVLAKGLPAVPIAQLHTWVPVGLLGVFLFWQIVPLFTLSTGWSLQLNKLRVFPLSDSALFGIEVILRLTSAPEMVIVLAGGITGLLRHPAIPFLAPLLLLLYIPFNLFLQLAIRDLILYSFERHRFRELFAALVISISILPQLLARTRLGRILKPYFFAAAHGYAAPWREAASLSLGSFSVIDAVLLVAWILGAYALARWQFKKSFRHEEIMRRAVSDATSTASSRKARLLEWPARLFRDPLASLLQKELRSLVRMPRFRVLFGMACIFSVIVFVPITFNQDVRHGSSFVHSNFLPIVNLYGLLLLSDVLLLNVFGLDRSAVQLYFVAPVPLETVVKAKNLAAIVFVALQTIAVLLIALVIRASVTPLSAFAGAAASAVATIYLLAFGNIASISMARPVDPAQTFKKQAGARMQLWLLLCGVCMYVVVGFAFLARWALQSDWALLGILLLEFAVGIIVYRFATESAIQRGVRDRERLVEALSKGPSLVSIG